MSVDISPDGSWIAFDLLGHIYRMDAAGGESTVLTQSSGIAVNTHPTISPDGREIAFVSDRGGQDNLWVMKADGSSARQIYSDMKARVAEPAWTPDGKTIVVTKRNEQYSGFYRTIDELWQFPRQGGEGKRLVNFAYSSDDAAPANAGLWVGVDRAQWASFTPDGRYVYFHSSAFTGSGRQLRRMDRHSGHIDTVTESTGRHQACCGRPAYPLRLGEVAPEVSPDGKWLAFARKLPGGRTAYRGKEIMGRTALWLRNLETGDERIIMDPISSTVFEYHPSWHTRTLPGYSWASDGQSIILSQGGKIRRLWLESGRVDTIKFSARVHRTISEQARGEVTLDDRQFTARSLRWPASSPDGSRLVFEAAGQLWIMKLPDGKPAPLLPAGSDAFAMTPSWSPDGLWITYVTSDEVAGGHVWKISARGGVPEKITAEPGIYMYPNWLADGRSILVSRWPQALTPDLDLAQWQWQLISAQDGTTKSLTDSAFPITQTIGQQERVYYIPGNWDSQPWAAPVNGRILMSADLNGDNEQQMAVLPTRAVSASPSPDGKWVVIGDLANVYLAPLPQGTGEDKPAQIDLEKTGKQLSLEGGAFPRWRDNKTVEFVGPKSYFTHHIDSGKTDRVDIDLKIERAIARGRIALTGARIITMEDRKVITRGSVIIEDGRISCVGKCNSAGVDKKINLKGKTIMPGWIDLHAHHLQGDNTTGIIPRQRRTSAAYLAYGVTTIHDPFVMLSHGWTVGEMIAAGKITGPRSYASPGLTCGQWSYFKNISSFEDARHLVNWLGDLGVISIKDYKQCTRVQRTWLAEATRQRGLTQTSEGSDLDYLLGLAMTGHAGWEHSFQIHPIYSDVSRFFGQSGTHYSVQFSTSDYPVGNALEYWLEDSKGWQDDKLMRWNAWKEMAARITFVKKPKREFQFPLNAEAAADIKRAGGYVAMGAHGEQDGLSSHWEVWSAAEAMTAQEALETATMDSAHFLGLEKEMGSVTVGKLADLVVLNSNPLDNIRNTTDIAYVMKAGRIYVADTLEEIWPRQKPYGNRPWSNPEATRGDLRADDYWNR